MKNLGPNVYALVPNNHDSPRELGEILMIQDSIRSWQAVDKLENNTESGAEDAGEVPENSMKSPEQTSKFVMWWRHESQTKCHNFRSQKTLINDQLLPQRRIVHYTANRNPRTLVAKSSLRIWNQVYPHFIWSTTRTQLETYNFLGPRITNHSKRSVFVVSTGLPGARHQVDGLSGWSIKWMGLPRGPPCTRKSPEGDSTGLGCNFQGQHMISGASPVHVLENHGTCVEHGNNSLVSPA